MIDGFTFQNNNLNQPACNDRVRFCQSWIDRILEKVPNMRTLNLNGMGFGEWFSYAKHANFYITHEGTMQHKLGWLLPNLEGLCLTASSTARAVIRWHRDQCETSAPLHCLPSDCFAFKDEAGVVMAQRNREAEFVDLDRAVSEAVAILDVYFTD